MSNRWSETDSSAALRMLVLSDLHVDFYQNVPRVEALARAWRAVDADVLVVAGDVGHKLAQVESTLALFSDVARARLFVPGNHDIWIVREGREPVATSWDKLHALAEVCRRTRFVCLEEKNATVRGFHFVGSMGWYDYSFANPDLQFDASVYESKRWGELRYMDGPYARWGIRDEEVLERLLAGLERRLAAAADPLVFVSHHVPLEELVLRRGRASWDFFNAYMGSRRLESMLRGRGIQRFVFGHTHRPVSLVEPGRFVVNNPLGYPRQSLTPTPHPFVVD